MIVIKRVGHDVCVSWQWPFSQILKSQLMLKLLRHKLRLVSNHRWAVKKVKKLVKCKILFQGKFWVHHTVTFLWWCWFYFFLHGERRMPGEAPVNRAEAAPFYPPPFYLSKTFNIYQKILDHLSVSLPALFVQKIYLESCYLLSRPRLRCILYPYLFHRI